jgi:hypothetical protein
MYIFGGFDGVKRNDIYRILIDPYEMKKNLEEQDQRLGSSFVMVNQSIAEFGDLN